MGWALSFGAKCVIFSLKPESLPGWVTPMCMTTESSINRKDGPGIPLLPPLREWTPQCTLVWAQPVNSSPIQMMMGRPRSLVSLHFRIIHLSPIWTMHTQGINIYTKLIYLFRIYGHGWLCSKHIPRLYSAISPSNAWREKAYVEPRSETTWREMLYPLCYFSRPIMQDNWMAAFLHQAGLDYALSWNLYNTLPS